MKKQSVAVLLPEETVDRVDKLRDETGRSRSSVIRMLLKRALQNEKMVESLYLRFR